MRTDQLTATLNLRRAIATAKRSGPNPALVAMAQIKTIDAATVQGMAGGLECSLDRMRIGTATLTDLRDFRYATIVAHGIEKHKIIRGLAEYISAAIKAVHQIEARQADEEKIPTLYGDEISALHEFIHWHRFQLSTVSQKEYTTVLRSVAREIGGSMQARINKQTQGR
jgi:hypothetical protein